MDYIFENLEKIQKRIKNKNLILLLDFDLTLSPLAKNPGQAFLPQKTKSVLNKISRHVPVAIITGRTIQDIKNRIGLKKLLYVGNHGLEYVKNGVVKKTPLSSLSKKGLKHIKKMFLFLEKKYPEIIIEDKKLTIAFTYRMIHEKKIKNLIYDIQKINSELKKYNLYGVLYKKTFEVRPRTKVNKGTASLFALKKISKKNKMSFYIGDGRTDEDAFKALKNGVTIRVGKSKSSVAKYYVRNVGEVRKFLLWFLSLYE